MLSLLCFRSDTILEMNSFKRQMGVGEGEREKGVGNGVEGNGGGRKGEEEEVGERGHRGQRGKVDGGRIQKGIELKHF